MGRRRGRNPDAPAQEPARVGDAVRDLVSARGWNVHLALGRLKAEWPRVVGEQIAARSEPVRLEEGRLLIRAEAGAWAAELALMAPSLAEAAARFLDGEIVREAAVVAGGPGRPANR